MSKVLSVVLITAGLGLAFEMMPTIGPERSISFLSSPRPSGAAFTDAAVAQSTTTIGSRSDRSGLREFAPNHPLAVFPRAAGADATQPIAAAALATAAPARSPDLGELARLLQTELKRVGCYHGDVDGDWGVGSKRAMAAFTQRVNATLPTDQPDLVLLSLVQGHGNKICASECGTGQMMSSRGRCVSTPNEIQAAAPATNRWRAVVTTERRAIPERSTVGIANAPTAVSSSTQRVAVAPVMPSLTTPPINGQSLTESPRIIDWGTRMSVGATPPTPSTPLATPPVQPAAVMTPPAAVTTTSGVPSAVSEPPVVAQTDRLRRPAGRQRAARPTPQVAARPEVIARPRSNWRREVFAARN